MCEDAVLLFGDRRDEFVPLGHPFAP
jgi:hypothetical protein